MRFGAILSILVVFCAAPVVGQSRAFDCLDGKQISSTEAQELVAKVQESYAKVQSFKAEFFQDSYVAALEVSEGSAGQVWFSKPGKMKWLYEKPEQQTFIVRDETLWLYQNRENQVLIDDFKNAVISDLPVAFLMGLGNLSRDFKLVGACASAEGPVLEFRPANAKSAGSNPQSALKSFSLLVGGDGFPKGAKVSDVGGNTTALLLDHKKLSDSFEEKIFAADFPKGADINDRRSKDKA
jgi:outer membrane lipoprotein carrier protein